jgi:hypothetical protein
MFAGALALWVGVPLGWLWIGSLVEGETDSLGAAVGVMFAGALASIVAIVWMLGWLNRKHGELREQRGLESYGNVALEGVMALSAGVAVIGFAAWFFLFSGSSPVPTNLGF